MIELIFVIVIIGILASVAIPKLTATRDDAIDTASKRIYDYVLIVLLILIPQQGLVLQILYRAII
ncbi:MAG: hypothetical protein Q9M36_09035 [Sulfurovum sp.]|nr:hypothetical protein [Sulfurovum sp.]